MKRNKNMMTLTWILLLLCGLVFQQKSSVLGQDDQIINQLSMKDLVPPGLFVGSVFHGPSPTWLDQDYRALVTSEFNIMTSSIYLSSVWPSEDVSPDTSHFRSVIDYCISQNILVHGHALVFAGLRAINSPWWRQQPNTTVENNMYRFMKVVIDAAADTTSGGSTLWSVDVVNEPMGDDGNPMDEDGVRTAMFDGTPIREYDVMGQDYIRRAFVYARDNLPDYVKLMLTDYGCEQDDPDNNNEKSDRLYRFVEKLLSQGVRIDAVGFQMHVGSEHGNQPNYVAIARNFERFRGLGVEIHITEMDVQSFTSRVKSLEENNFAMLERAAQFQSRVFARILQVCLEEPACTSFRFWDVAEYNSAQPNVRYSWLHPVTHEAQRRGIFTFPTPFWDIARDNFRPKPAWKAMKEAILDFSRGQGGVYRLTSGWISNQSYVGRVGSLVDGTSDQYVPSSRVALFELNDNSQEWSSLLWRLEQVDVVPGRRRNIYRLQNQWANGYLTRDGRQVDETTWEPVGTVSLHDLNLNWTSQEWIIEPVGFVDSQPQSYFKIRCVWDPNNNGQMTRLGVLAPDGSGMYQPTNQISLQPDANYGSQQWYLYREE